MELAGQVDTEDIIQSILGSFRFFGGGTHDPSSETERPGCGFYADRAAGGDRHYRHSHRFAFASGPENSRVGQSPELPEQLEANRSGLSQSSRPGALLPLRRM